MRPTWTVIALSSGLRLLGGVFVGDGPARRFGGEPRRFPLREGVELDDRAVGLVGEAAAHFVQFVDGGHQLVGRAAVPGLLGRLEAQRAEPREHLVLRPRQRRGAFDLPQAVEHDVQRALGDDARVELLERAGGGVARIGKQLLAGRLAFRVQLLEAGLGQVDFAAHFEQARAGFPESPPRSCRRGAVRDAADGPQIGGDVVPGGAVAAGGAAGEDALLVAQVDGHAVDLGLDDPFERFARQEPLDAVDELAQLLLRIGVVQAESSAGDAGPA